MVMPENQILLDYKAAADQKEQVKILAELNQTDVWTMAKWLKEHGASINLQKFQRWNPKWRDAVDRDVRHGAPETAAAPEEQEDPPAADPEAPRPTVVKYQAALREAEALRERNNELYKQICDLTRELAEMKKPDRKAAATTAAAEPERTALTDAQKIRITKILIKTYYDARSESAGAYLDILDAIINEEEDE